MLMPDLQPDTWGTIQTSEREKYNALKRTYLALHLKRAQETAGLPVEENEEIEDINVVNPLSVDESVRTFLYHIIIIAKLTSS